MTLKIQVTDAGRAALVNAQNTGTLPVTVAKIGVTDQAFVADALLNALPGQLKQLDTFSGSAVAADTIHVTIRDFSTDTYSLRGFGLFLADGTLFAAYGQADPILEKSAQAAMLLATDVIFADIDAASLTFGDTNFLNPPATTEVQGVIEIATDQESIDGLDGQRAVPPKGLLAVLNARFGAGAPSAFVKGLLTAATALAFRTALAIKGAALYDTGTGNGLDADLLDGQHGAYYRDYASLQNVPATFTPSPHPHSAADITSGTLVVARGGTGAGTLPAGSYLVGNGTDPITSKTPAQVLVDIGAAAKVHSHAIGDVNGLQGALDAKAPLVSPALTGAPTAPTAPQGTNNTQLATTAHVFAGLALKAPIDSPQFTGTPKLPATGTNVGSNGGLIYETATPGEVGVRAGASSYFTFSTDGSFNVMNGLLYSAKGAVFLPADGTGDCVSFGVNRLGQTNMYGAGNEANYVYLKGPSGCRWYLGHNADGGASDSMELGPGGLTINGNLTVTGTANIQGSDRRLKRNLKKSAARPLHRGLSLYDYLWRYNGAPGRSLIAQHFKKNAPEYIYEFNVGSDNRPKMRLGIDYARAGVEMAMWASAEVDRLEAVVEKQGRQIAQLMAHVKALGR